VLGLLGWTAVAHNSGSGWVQALGCLLAGFVVVGLVGGAPATARVSARVVACPTDATAGRPVVLELRTSAAARLEPLEPAGPTATVPAGGGRIEVVPTRRGELTVVQLRVGSAAPFGLLWWTKRVELALPRSLWVAPLPTAADPALVAVTGQGALSGRNRAGHALAGDVRGVRPYAAGDARRAVHWPSSAHQGILMVREVERPELGIPSVAVVLPDDGPAGDEVAARALATVLALLARGAPVLVATTEAAGPRNEAVYGPADAARRMARAVAPR
jgi:uncharacterized protein (DUF58 family)